MRPFAWAALVLFVPLCGTAQSPTASGRPWRAQWIDVPETVPEGYGVYHFRRSWNVETVPSHLVVRISGDNRYQLFINGVRVAYGPARGDLTHWRYETVDLAPHLHSGRNVLAAVVWNDGEYRAVAQVSNRTGFVLEAASPADSTVNTGKAWVGILDKAYSPVPPPSEQRTGYYALAANERMAGALYPWGWTEADFNDSTWKPAHEISKAADRDARDAPNRWMLVPSGIPQEEQTLEKAPVLRTAQGVAPGGFPAQPLTVPAHSYASLLLDQTYLTTAYPALRLSGGAGAEVRVRYAETLYRHVESGGGAIDKGNRNDIEGKRFVGPADTYLADGGNDREYRPLFWRTFRYVKLEVQTGDEPLTLKSWSSTFTAYPFGKSATFTTQSSEANADIQRILTTGWRTARLCAHETYMDCPYYEQLQYGGDARIQMMVSLYMTGDARLMKNGIALLNSSRTAEGATLSRAPSALQQYIPPFSLWWIGMVHDYWMYVDDPAFVKQMLPGVRSVLSFYAAHQKPNASLGPMPWWNFVDWVKQWKNGEPPADPDGASAAALDLQLLLAYRWAADLEESLGYKAWGDQYRTEADRLATTVLATDWDSAHGLFADQPAHQTYSQQVNTLAVLAKLGSADQRHSVMTKVMSDATLAQSSIYFRAYTNAALREAGLGDDYLQNLGPWRDMLGQGLTTWAEWSGPDARSDCHAWGASPNFELLRTVAGIESAAPGFAKVRVAPHLGTLPGITAEMPHPKGNIRVRLTRSGGKNGGSPTGEIDLPAGVSGEWVVANRTVPLHEGLNRLP